MEWQEILDKYRVLRQTVVNREGYVIALEVATTNILEKLASEEAAKPEEEPVKDGFRLCKRESSWVTYSFKDYMDNDCIIQNSSLATKAAIWLGGDEHRMHLTQEMVRALLPKLQEFVEKGEIG